MDTNVLVEVDDLVVEFPTEKGDMFHAVDGVSLDVSPGERLGIVGESGSGKSITAQAMLRLVPTPGVITGGEIRFDGRDVMKMSSRDIQRWRGADAGMIFQDPMSSLNPLMRVGQQVRESLEIHLHMNKKKATQRTVELLNSVGLPDAESRSREYPGAFSGGMRQRVCIAIAMACSPRLVIADEPTTALDVTVQAQVLDLLDQMADELRTAVILISHDLGIVSNFCDRILVMYAGRIVESGTTDEIIGDPKHPYTRALLNSISLMGQEVPNRLTSIAGTPPVAGARSLGCSFAPRCPLVVPRCLEVDPTLVPYADNSSRKVACGVVAPEAFSISAHHTR